MSRSRSLSRRWARTRRRLRMALVVSMTMLVGVVMPATAATAPSGYTTVSGWSYSGSSATATLPSPYSGSVTVAGQSGQVAVPNASVPNSVNVEPDPSSAHPLYDCMASTGASTGFVKQCNTYTATITFSSPVTNPVLLVRGGGGYWVSPDGTQCVLGYTSSASITSVNGGSSTGLVSLASPLDSGLSFSGSTITRSSSQISGCGANNGTNVWGQEYLQVSGTVTSVTFTYVMSAKVTQNSSGAFSSWVPAADYGGLTTAVLLPTTPPASLDTVKKIVSVNGAPATSATQVSPGDVIVYSIVTTNSGGTAGTTILSDPVPANTSYTGSGEGWSCATGSTAGTACTQSVTVQPGTSVSKTYTVTVASSLPAGVTTIANLVTPSVGTCSSCNPSNPVALPSLKLVKSASLTKDVNADGKAGVGDQITFSFLVTNNGSVTLHKVTIADQLVAPAGPAVTVTCPTTTLEPGASLTCTSTAYTVTQADVGAGSVANMATAHGTTPQGPVIASNDSRVRVATDSSAELTWSSAASGFGGSVLAFTGSNVIPLTLAGLLAIILGLFMSVASRRRREQNR